MAVYPALFFFFSCLPFDPLLNCIIVFSYFLNARKRVFSTVETAGNFGWLRVVIRSDEGGKEGCDEGMGD